MNEGDLLYRAVLENPEEDDPRLRLADWYRDAGQSDRADFIQLQIAAEREEDESRAFDLYQRSAALLRGGSCALANAARWFDGPGFYVLAEKAPGTLRVVSQEKPGDGRIVYTVDFVRGFPHRIATTLFHYMAAAESLFRQFPIAGVSITDRGPRDFTVEGNGFLGFAWKRSEISLPPPNDLFRFCYIPAVLFDRMKGGPREVSLSGFVSPDNAASREWIDRTYVGFSTSGLALEIFSGACVAHGRELAGLSPLVNTDGDQNANG